MFLNDRIRLCISFWLKYTAEEACIFGKIAFGLKLQKCIFQIMRETGYLVCIGSILYADLLPVLTMYSFFYFKKIDRRYGTKPVMS